MRVLLVEDDEYLLSALSLALQRKEHEVQVAKDGDVARAALAGNTYDLVLLDLGLPATDGTDVLRRLRKEGNNVPVIIISARDGIEQRVQGLDLGANDYLIKPFDFRELEARMRAAVRQTQWNNQVEIHFGSLSLNTQSGMLRIGGTEVELTPKESTLLKMLLSKAGSVVAKRELVEQLSDFADEATYNSIDILVHRLRRKLEQSDVVVNTVRGFGYRVELKS